MGPPGAGKSYVRNHLVLRYLEWLMDHGFLQFIDLLTNQMGRRVGNSLKSGTTEIQATRVRHPRSGDDNIVLVDTPPFDDNARTDIETLTMFGDWLGKM
jgi:hypothetical protein